MHKETIAIHAGNHTDEGSHAVIQPIVMSTTFVRDDDGSTPKGFIYGRADNPNRAQLEKVICALEGGADAAAFSSGNAAGMTIFQSLKPGTHIIAPDDMYHGLNSQLKAMFNGILEFDFVDLTDASKLESYIKPNTGLLWIETPSNPQLKISDIKRLTRIAHENNIKVVCDNTFASPICQLPLSLGADIVMYSATKYFGGHSDITGGALVTAKNDGWWQNIRNIQQLGGAVPAPMDCYFLVRSIKTLPYRMRGHVHNAHLLAEFLEQHPKVENVMYPGLPSHPQYELAKEQMLAFGGMLSFNVKGGTENAIKVIQSVRLFTRATSLGGVESLIEHRAAVEPPDTKTPWNLLRVSVGLEHIDDLIADISQALDEI
ncbi:trans-sulfuration enzyme family protein [Mucilaginibacter ginkgonis]|uniref:Aminotransferase class V-fold PLP-dependent enzyme n=1 Tax=Mucilaginibacter ginkgonis TaxID=2682091 RepID=A0A6I4HXX6_9SPHI|nr:aminotransferase class V-fold PLP-dependent enzyme [Mucilaginibacter ginkgonis]QQL51165.1 aminotransferase class V-fold PLP-dependent enzyme [Mucilaginibacter ginkgonis]